MFEVVDLDFSRAGRCIFHTLSVRFSKKRVALLGASGSGKSTLLRLLAGLEHADGGQLRFQNASFEMPMWKHRRTVALVSQEPMLTGSSLREALILGLQLQGLEAPGDTLLLELFQLLSLDHLGLDHKPAQVSGGERMRLAILRALLTQPKALLLDEPTAGLDPASRESLLRFLSSEHPLLPAFLLTVSHDLHWLQAMDVCYQLTEEGVQTVDEVQLRTLHLGQSDVH
jgi:sulfate/thiosulfate transport system ATP-binding protein